MVLVEEDIGTLHVSVEDLELVQGFEAPDDLNDNLPNVLLLHELFVVLALADALEHVAIVSKFHHDTKKANDGSQNVKKTNKPKVNAYLPKRI